MSDDNLIDRSFNLDLSDLEKSSEQLIEILRRINEKKSEEPFNKFLKQVRRQQLALDKEKSIEFIGLLIKRKFEILVCEALDWLHDGDILKNEDQYLCLELMLSQVWYYTSLSDEFVRSLCCNTEIMDIFESLLTNKKCRKRIGTDPRIKAILAITISIIDNAANLADLNKYFKGELTKGLEELSQCEQNDIRLVACLILPKISSSTDNQEEKIKDIKELVAKLMKDLNDNNQQCEESLQSFSNLCFTSAAQDQVVKERGTELLVHLIKSNCKISGLAVTCLYRLALKPEIYQLMLSDGTLDLITDM